MANPPSLPPSLRKFQLFIADLNKESERGTVLIASSYIDDLLKQMIEAFFVDVDEKGSLLKSSGPLGAFSSRIDAAYCCGLLSQAEQKDCHIIRSVRNRFAHEVEMSFADQSVADKTKNFSGLGRFMPQPDQPFFQLDARERFTVTSVDLIMELNNRVLRIPERRLMLQSWEDE